MDSDNEASKQAPAGKEPESAGQVLGVGGLFMASEDPAATAEWYHRVLGMRINDYGGFDFLHAHSAARFPEGARTVFAPFAAAADYFKPSTLPFMLNLIVDDLEAVMARALAAGEEPVQPAENTDYGNFAWLMDPDGRKVELWQPPS
ncbi:MAG: VOC family protein [Pseudomonadota bacterium]